jgi:hypothetical protein
MAVISSLSRNLRAKRTRRSRALIPTPGEQFRNTDLPGRRGSTFQQRHRASALRSDAPSAALGAAARTGYVRPSVRAASPANWQFLKAIRETTRVHPDPVSAQRFLHDASQNNPSRAYRGTASAVSYSRRNTFPTTSFRAKSRNLSLRPRQMRVIEPPPLAPRRAACGRGSVVHGRGSLDCASPHARRRRGCGRS